MKTKKREIVFWMVAVPLVLLMAVAMTALSEVVIDLLMALAG